MGAPCPMHAAACSTPAADTIFQGTEATSRRNCCQTAWSMSGYSASGLLVSRAVTASTGISAPMPSGGRVPAVQPASSAAVQMGTARSPRRPRGRYLGVMDLVVMAISSLLWSCRPLAPPREDWPRGLAAPQGFSRTNCAAVMASGPRAGDASRLLSERVAVRRRTTSAFAAARVRPGTRRGADESR